MKITFQDQLLVGVWLSVAVALGILLRSSGAATSAIITGAFFLAPVFAYRLLKSPRPVVRYGSMAVAVAWLAVFAGSVLSIAERLYYVNAPSYPTWLASGELSPGESLEELRSHACKGRGPLEISQKADGVFLVRCGLMWYDSKTYIAHFDPTATAQ